MSQNKNRIERATAKEPTWVDQEIEAKKNDLERIESQLSKALAHDEQRLVLDLSQARAMILQDLSELESRKASAPATELDRIIPGAEPDEIEALGYLVNFLKEGIRKLGVENTPSTRVEKKKLEAQLEIHEKELERLREGEERH